MTATAYPLTWPTGWPRTSPHRRVRASFGKVTSKPGRSWDSKEPLTLHVARQRLMLELDRLEVRDALLSTNVELRLDGWPRSDRRTPADCGAAVYFTLKGQPIALACDKWDRVEDNVAAIAKHIDALRGMNRWGVGTAEQVFRGYAALPAPEPWWKVLGLDGETRDPDKVRAAWATRSREVHPDRPGGSHDKQAAVNVARDDGLALISALY
jgi:hypothetical protein